MRTKHGGTVKEIAITAAGIIIAFIPDVISNIFYIIGGIIIAASIITLISSIFSGEAALFLPSSIVGIVIGGAVTAIPAFTHIIIPLAIGIILGLTGIDLAAKALYSNKSRNSKIISGALGIICIVAALMMIFNLVKAGTAARVIIGLVIAAVGVYNIISDINNSGGGDNSEPNIIDI